MICKKCGTDKDFNESNFPKDIRLKSGLRKTCRSCATAAVNAYQKSNRDKVSLSRRNREASYKNIGKCVNCKNPVVKNNKSYCEKHLVSMMASRHLGSKKMYGFLIDLLLKQRHRCAYTGVELIIGENASIDHIKSKAKNLELFNDSSNVQWVDIRVNLMKRELHEIEFLDIINMIYNNKIGMIKKEIA